MPQVALAAIMSNPIVTAPIVGCTSIEQLEGLVDALDVTLTDEEIAYLREAYRPRKEAFVTMTNTF